MSGSSGSRRKSAVPKGLLPGAILAAPMAFKVLEVQGWPRDAEASIRAK
jgi:hypothetical protein